MRNWDWTCFECGATGPAATRTEQKDNLRAHWLEDHQEVPW